ncbi:methyltransferase domain-containing protein [Aliarcobacter butzleri]|uniref:methyltransferase domain-containing protein n=3 Tax=Aliarcobacter butzleri TaxID=28197 RepID=UPI0021B6690B|nr:methyltransferase domain-containing protein [Aliarcobacter butzleri]MCT7593183.1 methyltransferase domain-containing protein [Aliarcobacter butzleri]
MNIIGSNSLYNIPFDQYQRYKTTSLIIENYKDENKSLTILEIGANEHKNLEKFLPDDKIKYLDIQLTDYLKQDENYILADATNMPQIEDDSFDVVIALDVFEHIPQSLRKSFLSELYRVAKGLVVLSGPFDEDRVSNTEKKVNQFYKEKYGEDYIWLKEHIENKLPDLSSTLNYLESDLTCKVDLFSHGSLEIWEKLMQLHFEVAANIRLQNYRMNIDNFYNRYLYKYDISDTNYRKFLILNKKRDNNFVPFTKKISNIPLQDMEFFNDFIESLYTLSANFEQSLEQERFIQLFLEDGKEISEENSIKAVVEQNNEAQAFEFNVSDRKNITLFRVDPLNDYCIIKINKILLNDIEIKTIQTNACYEEGNIYYFNTNDPQLYIKVPDNKKIEKLTIALEYLHIGEGALKHVVNDLLKAFTTKDQNIQSLNAELETKDQNIQSLNAELETKDQNIQSLNAELETKDQNIQSLNAELETKDQNIQSLNAELETKDQNIQDKSLDIAIIKQRLKLYHSDMYHQILGEL